MADLSAFPITSRWPAKDPDCLQLYSTPTPNGVKVSIMLEEVGLAYEPHFIDIGANETWGPEYLSLNLPADPGLRYETIQWVFFQVGAIGPMFGQVGFFHKFAGRDYEDKRPLQRYVAESKRLLGVLETRLAGRDWIMDDYSIADVSMLGWVRGLVNFYKAGDLVDFGTLKLVPAWLERGLARPAVQRGLDIPKRG